MALKVLWGKNEDNEMITTYRIDGTEKLVSVKNNEETSYQLHEVDKKEIFNRRMKNVPTFVLKVGEKLYVSDAPLYRLSIKMSGECHQCFSCIHARATDEQLGGCNKVRDCDSLVYLSEGHTPKSAIRYAKRVEKYPFIQYGYETFGVGYNDIFCVEACQNYKPFARKLSGRPSLKNLVKREKLIKKLRGFY